MTLINRRNFVILSTAGLASGCAAPALISRNDPFEGGIGGTGIVGMLTDFGSLMVNGLRVELGNATQINSAYGTLRESDLAIGTPLTISATLTRDRFVARSIEASFPLTGTLLRTKNGLSMNGVRVIAEPGAIGRARIGTRMTLSGIWTSLGLVVSRFQPALGESDLLAGVTKRDSKGNLTVEGVPVTLPPMKSRPRPGEYVTMLGRYQNAQFQVSSLQRGRFQDTRVSLQQLSVEGFLDTQFRDPGYRIAGLGHSFAPGVRLDPLRGERAVYFGRYTGLFRASTSFSLPQNFSERRAFLRDGLMNRTGVEFYRTL